MVARPAPTPPRATAQGSGAATAERTEPGRGVLGLSYALVTLLAFGLGIYGSFLVPAGPRVAGLLVSYGIAVAVVGNVALALAGLALTRTRMGALLVLAGWLLAVLPLSSSRPEGDLVLQGNARGYAFLVLGALAPVGVAVLGRPSRGLTALGPLPPTKR